MRLRREGRLVKTEAGRENEWRVVFLQEIVDDVQEAIEITILSLVTNGDERGRDVRRHANGVLDVEALGRNDQHTAHALPIEHTASSVPFPLVIPPSTLWTLNVPEVASGLKADKNSCAHQVSGSR